MEDLHARMLGALLAGEGLRGVARLASTEAGRPVAIVLPTRGMSECSNDEIDLAELTGYAARRGRGERAEQPAFVEAVTQVEAGDEPIGLVAVLAVGRNGMPDVAVDREEVLRTTALATLTEVAMGDARDEVTSEVRGSLLEDLRARRVAPGETVRRAARLRCDLSRGVIVLVVAMLGDGRPHHTAALIRSAYEGAIAEPLPPSDEDGSRDTDARVYAVLPARGDGGSPERTAEAARALANRLRPHGRPAFSSFCATACELPRAFAEAELMLAVTAVDERLADNLADGMDDGIYRLLFRAMATEPDEVRRFYSETVEPLVEHDRDYRTDLLGTLESYLAHDCNMNATARAVYAHRHTVAHRLARIRELTGLDPAVGADRERLGLGIKAYRILEPTLPR
jgi:sugar diacid utilization regulator